MPNGYYGQAGLGDDTSEENILAFYARQSTAYLFTGFPVVVKKVTGGGVDTPPTVDVQPLVKQIDVQGNATSHGVIFGLPVMRIQGGKGAIIADPVAGDIGWVLAADRDISAVKSNQGKESTPGSFRRHSMADGIYMGAILNPGVPDNYVQFTTDGVKVFGKGGNSILLNATGLEVDDKNGNKIKMTSTGINLNGVIIDSSGNITTPGGVTAGSGGVDQVTLQHHVHPTAALGPPSQPTPGT